MEHDKKYDQQVRGYRNNNPLNLRLSSNRWLGKVPGRENTDGRFEQFERMDFGFRAAIKNMQVLISSRGCTTLLRLIQRWAPVSDGNNPYLYCRTVSRQTGLHRDYVLQASDLLTLGRIAYAMAIVENGSAPQQYDVDNAVEMLRQEQGLTLSK